MSKKPLGDAIVYSFMLIGRIIKKMEADEIEITELSSRQIKNFVTQKWETLKNKKEGTKDKVKLSRKQEKEVISRVVHALRKLKKAKKSET